MLDPLKDITGYVEIDPQHPYPIGCGIGGEVYRGMYTWTNPKTLQVSVRKVSNTFINIKYC